MEPFHTLTGIAAPLPIANVDTDMLLSAKFLKTVSRIGLGQGLLHALRIDEEGRERPDFILNREPWRQARILIAFDNFGCGSSREHAPWALLDFGIRAIIAPGFADIFYGNCFKNGILPITLPRATVDLLMAKAGDPATATIMIDLEARTIVHAGGVHDFALAAEPRARLLGGIDDIAHALTFDSAIAAQEARTRDEAPWLADAHLEAAL
jgi:3-isopropylmalate/(R)-2-methylmalate dehydratase small subunit